MHYLDKMVKMKSRIKIEDVLFWILAAAIVSICIWMLNGSPALESALITLGLFVIGSEALLWKKFFAIDKNTAIGFVKVSSDLKEKHNEIKNELVNMKNEFTDIKNLIKEK